MDNVSSELDPAYAEVEHIGGVLVYDWHVKVLGFRYCIKNHVIKEI